MNAILFSSTLPDGREVCVSPVSKDAFDANGAQTLGDDSGYFIYECDNKHPFSGIEILAKAVSQEAALRLVDIFVMAGRRHRTMT
jgi:hypothetical protein